MVAILRFLQNPDKLKVCVKNRVWKIKKINFTILYVPGYENPPNYTTKTTSIDKYSNTEFWQFGPNFVSTDTDNPSFKYCIEYSQDGALSTKIYKELKAEKKTVKASTLVQKAKELSSFEYKVFCIELVTILKSSNYLLLSKIPFKSHR